MYVNTLISLQENIPTYGVEGKTVTGHVTISTPGIIRCYVQNLKRTNNRTFELYVLSSKQDTGIKIGELSNERETKWRVDEHSVMGSSIALADIDGVAIIVKENELRGVDAVLLGFKEERFTVLPILESIVPKSRVVEPIMTNPPAGGPGPVIPNAPTQGPGPVIPNAPTQGPGPVIPNPPTQGPGPVIPNPPTQGPGPVIPNPPTQGPGPVIPNPPTQGPGPVIPNPPTQGPGPVILSPPTQGPGPVIPNPPTQGPVIPNVPEQEPGPVIIPDDSDECPEFDMPELEPGPVIIPQNELDEDESEGELETVMSDRIKSKVPYIYNDEKDSLSEEMKKSREAIDKITEKLKMIKAHSEAETEPSDMEETTNAQEGVWHLETDRNIESDLASKAEETPEEIDYLAEIEKKLQEIQGRLKDVRSNGDGSEDGGANNEDELGEDEEPEEAPAFEETEDNETLQKDTIDLERLEIRRTENAIGDILKKVKSLRKYESRNSINSKAAEDVETEKPANEQQVADESKESQSEYSDNGMPLGVSKGELYEIYARGEAVEAFIQEDEDTEWVRIAYGDFLKIPGLSYEWCTQPFITFAFYKYNEILLGHNGKDDYYLGIPDIYHPDRKVILSDPMPVEKFLCRRNIEPAVGEYGYWIIPLQQK